MQPFLELDRLIKAALPTLDTAAQEYIEGQIELESPNVAKETLLLLQKKLQLSELEMRLVIILFAPELYNRYQKIYAYLQEDLNRPYPTVQLLDMLLCDTPQQSHALYHYFITPSKLTMLYLIEFIAEDSDEMLFSKPLRLSTPLRNYLLGDRHIEGALPSYAQLLEPIQDEPYPIDIEPDHRYLINLHGYADEQKKRKARVIASQLGFGLLVVDSLSAFMGQKSIEKEITCLIRDALLSGSILYLEHFESWVEKASIQDEHLLLERFEQLAWVSIVSTKSPWHPIHLPKTLTLYALKEITPSTPQRLTNGLNRYARAIVSSNTMEDIVIPTKQKEQLHEITTHYAHQDKVFTEWGYQKFFQSEGITLLFSGASGTGKTMAASILANGLGLSLYKIDLAHMVSKYIGETEKNLATIFELAQGAGVVLFFDEADALFGKRSEVKEAHDRYANIEVSYLLQRIEEYDGIVILASNFKENIDEAFLRRFRFIVDFPTPDATHREAIWHKVLPSHLLAEPIDFSALAKPFKLSGANIRNVALYAAFYAAEKDKRITKEHIIKALKNETEKIGSTVEEQDIRSFLEN
jgi:SpoVK/Ycf46/Vps4 family AAA+-type ATPase